MNVAPVQYCRNVVVFISVFFDKKTNKKTWLHKCTHPLITVNSYHIQNS